MWRDQRKNPLNFGPDQFFISFINKALASAEGAISIKVWSAGLLSLFQYGSLEYSPFLFFRFQRWSVPSRCQLWTPRSIPGFCLLLRVASLTTSLA